MQAVSTCLLAETRNTGRLLHSLRRRREGECHVIPAAPGEDEADVLDRARKVAGGKPVIIVTEADGELRARLMGSDDMISMY